MAKFKVGDRVRIVRSDYECHAGRMVGGTGTVTDVGRGERITILCDDFEPNDDGHWEFDAADLAPLEKLATADPLSVLIACGIITEAQADAARALVSP